MSERIEANTPSDKEKRGRDHFKWEVKHGNIFFEMPAGEINKHPKLCQILDNIFLWLRELEEAIEEKK